MKDDGYIRVELKTELHQPLKVIAASRNVDVRDLLSQIVKNFIMGRQKILEGIEKEAMTE